jgi:signal peptidase II
MPKWLGIAGLVLVLDQLTKYLVTRAFSLYEVLEVTPFFNLVLVYNRGAAFSFLSEAAGWQREFFIGVALLASGWIVWLLRRYPRETLFCFALSLILGGAVGNLVDRVLVGAVIDFLDFHVAGYHWPAFNIADAAISCGAVLLVWDAFRGSRNSAPSTAK